MDNTFKSLNLRKELIESVEILKYTSMTPIQEKSLPPILEGKDVIAQAKTGSGKTAAFGLGILNSLNFDNDSIHALVLCPTRELAEQVCSELRKLATALANVKIITICGGASEPSQIRSLSAVPHIVVGTPGRVLHLLDKDSFNLKGLNFFALDEADRMLDMGFTDEIKAIFKFLPEKRQSLLFSATFPEDIKAISKDFQKDAVEITVDATHEENQIEDIFIEVRPTQDKNNLLYKILGQYKPKSALVFCRTKKETVDVAEFLAGRNISVGCINGDLEQRDRTEVFTKFSNKSISILVATDVAARGLDVKELSTVINYNMPATAEDYVHRIGRTGRAGKKGLAFSFFNPAESYRLEDIEELTNKKCEIKDSSELSFTEKYNVTPPMKTLYISGGKKDKLRPGDVVGALTGEAKLYANDIGDINVHQNFTFVAVKRARAKQAVERLSAGRIKKKKFKVGFV
jgi:ATP-independent RNA helicase DbpA